MSYRLARNIIDGIEYIGSTIPTDKSIPPNLFKGDPENLLQMRPIPVQHEIAVGPSSNSTAAAFAPTCLAFINDRLLPFTHAGLSHFVDRFLELQDFTHFSEADPLEEYLADIKMMRTVLKPFPQALLGGRKVRSLLFFRDYPLEPDVLDSLTRRARCENKSKT